MTNFAVTQEFIERSQYNKEKILESEKLYERNFYAMGGSQEILQMLALAEPIQPQRILDIGSGLGGPAFLMARRYQASVDGIDFSSAMIDLSRERLREEELEGRVRLFQGNILTLEPEGTYDLLFSSSVFCHIHEKSLLVERLWHLLGEGGVLLFNDYCVGKESSEMQAYIELYRYHLLRMEEWLELLESQGFQKIAAIDCTDRLAHYTEEGLKIALNGEWDAMLKDIFKKRLDRIERGEHRWCVFCYRR
jgi:phosphoethanolamine N-methyltransferase